jgi:Ca2+:H+ antiporter
VLVQLQVLSVLPPAPTCTTHNRWETPTNPLYAVSSLRQLGLAWDAKRILIQPSPLTTSRDGPDALRVGSSNSSSNEKHDRSTASNGGGVNTSTSVAVPVNTAADGETSSALESVKRPVWSPTRIKDGSIRFLRHTKNALIHSYINVMLVFVPIGIAAKLAHLQPEIVFSMNAIAIIPLAGLLAHATEVVAARVGDALGALLNVSFGNAVELILFIILLASGQIEVVQASLLGSILANLLLILGMAFLLGGLKYQEQVSSCQCLSPVRVLTATGL